MKRKTSQLNDRDAKKPQGGHALGVANYTSDDVDALFDILEVWLPIGTKGWASVEEEFASWAELNSRPPRSAKSLEMKFKQVCSCRYINAMYSDFFLQLVRVSKPTGDAECPPQVECAHQIDWLMNEKAGTRELDDSEIVDAIEDDGDGDNNGDEDAAISISSDSEDVTKQVTHRKSASVKVEAAVPSLGPRARRSVSNRLDTPSASTRNTRMVKNTPTDLLNSISRSLDPSLSAARDEDRAARSLQTTQFLSLSNQLRDALATSNDLRNCLLQADRDRSDAERRADRAELQLEMERMRTGTTLSMHSPLYSRHSQGQHEPSGRDRRARCRVTRYRGGGESSIWVTPSDEEEEANRQPWLNDDIVSREYIDTTPDRPRNNIQLCPPRCRRPDFISTASSHTRYPAAEGAQIGITLTPSRMRSGNISVNVTPHHDMDAHLQPEEPYSSWEPTPPRPSGSHCD